MSTGLPHPQIMRGLQLKQLGRFADAATAFKEALAHEPNDAFALHQLAGCQWRIPELRKEALQTIDQDSRATYAISIAIAALHRLCVHAWQVRRSGSER